MISLRRPWIRSILGSLAALVLLHATGAVAASQGTMAAEALKVQLTQRCGPADPPGQPTKDISAQQADRLVQFNDRIRSLDDEDPKKLAALKEKLTYILTQCKGLNETFSVVSDITSILDANERYSEAIGYHVQAIGVYLYLGVTVDQAFAEARLQLADDYEELSKWVEAEEQIRLSIPLYKGTAGEEMWQKTARVHLAENLIHQHRFQEAEAELKGLGDLAKLSNKAGDAQYALGEAIEGQGRLTEAEAIWRKLKIDDRLLANLKLQGKSSEAADQMVAMDEKEKKADAEQESERIASEANLRLQRDAMLKNAAELEARGDRERAKKAREAAATLTQVLDAGKRGAEQAKALENRESAQQSQAFANAMNASPSQYPNERQMDRAALLFDAGRFEEAKPILSENCAKTIQMSAIDMELVPQAMTAQLEASVRKVDPEVTQSRPELGDFRATQACFQMLAVVQMKTATSASGFDNDEFASAQYGILSPSSLALTQAGARNYAASIGIAPDLAALETSMQAYFSSPQYSALIRGLEALMTAYAEQETDPGNPKQMMQLMTELHKAADAVAPMEGALAQKISALKAKAPDYFELRNPKPVDLAALQARSGAESALLKDNEALVLWMWAPDRARGLVYAISKNKSARVEMGLTSAAISERIRKLRSQIDPCSAGRQSGPCVVPPIRSFDRQASWELYRALLGAPEIQAVIGPQSISKLLIVPSGALTTLPPGLLITEEPEGGAAGDADPRRLAGESWLIANKAIAILPGVSALRTLRQASPRPSVAPAQSLYMFANPNFSGGSAAASTCVPGQRAAPRTASEFFNASGGSKAALASLNRLPCTQNEGVAIRNLIGGDLYTDLDASEARLRIPAEAAKIGNARLVAFATHGLVAGNLGLGEPALALAQPRAGEPDDGFLTASEILRIKMNADWVILSACNTASPDAGYADGLSGMSRAFLYAGAKALLVSHWRVDDLATQALITKAVALRRDGISKAEALRQASLALMRGELGVNDGSEAFPSAWAPFTLIGEPD